MTTIKEIFEIYGPEYIQRFGDAMPREPAIPPCSKHPQKLSKNCLATKNTWAEICPDSLAFSTHGAASCHIILIFITLCQGALYPDKTANGIRHALTIICRQGHAQIQNIQSKIY